MPIGKTNCIIAILQLDTGNLIINDLDFFVQKKEINNP